MTEIFNSISTIRGYLDQKKTLGQSVGLVPTMGSLHEGHFSLVKKALEENDLVVVSIFVNPTQFNKKEDLDNYPRDLRRDVAQLEKLGCHAVFTPEVDEMYPTKPSISFDAGYLESIMEGKFRPGHFSGVVQVVSKLFNIIDPDRAYFGQKDLQQLVLIQTLVRELNFDVEIVAAPTIREKSGLAMSSRNKRLNDDQLEIAAGIYKGLILIKSEFQSKNSVENAMATGISFYEKSTDFELEYLEIVDADTLLRIKNPNATENIAICVAGYVGGVRLLDNICVEMNTANANQG